MTRSRRSLALADLQNAGIDLVVGTTVNAAGLTLAKTVPTQRATAFVHPGLGASPLWHSFAIDQVGIVVNQDLTAVGDQRLRLNEDAIRRVDDGVAWGPLEIFDQDGNPDAACSRGALARVEERLSKAGLTALVGHEVEFFLVAADGSRLPSDSWAPYGAASLFEHENFVRDVMAACERAGVLLEQFHAEYGPNQFELSLSPASPVAAADELTLTRLILCRVARHHGIRISLSPAPFADSVGCGAHQHFSLTRHEQSLFSGGEARHGMTAAGESALAGILSGLPEAQAVLCGSLLSGLRTLPSHWSGAYACWGVENREAALRFIVGGPSNPHGAHAEVKTGDPSGNPYYATAVILGLALDGIDDETQLGVEVRVDPATLTEGERTRSGVVLLPSDHVEVIDAVDASTRIRKILGDRAINALVGVRRYEHDHYDDLTAEELTKKFRLAWSS